MLMSNYHYLMGHRNFHTRSCHYEDRHCIFLPLRIYAVAMLILTGHVGAKNCQCVSHSHNHKHDHNRFDPDGRTFRGYDWVYTVLGSFLAGYFRFCCALLTLFSRGMLRWSWWLNDLTEDVLVMIESIQ